MDNTAIFFMTIWRLHKDDDWCHCLNPWEAAWQRLVSFFTTIRRPHGHGCRHVFVYWEATATQLVSFLRPQGGHADTTGIISTTTGRPHEHDCRYFYDHFEAK